MKKLKFFAEQNWWGKLIGAFFGYLIAGPIGALFGILIGNFFDRGLVGHFSNPYLHYHSERQQLVQKIFLEASFSVMGYIAKADGRVSEQEIRFAKTLMQEMNLNSSQIKAAQNYFNEGKKPTFRIHHVIRVFSEAIHNNDELLNLFIDIQYRAAQVDGFSLKKQQALNNVLNTMGLLPLNQQYRFYQDFDKDHAYQTNRQRSSSSNQQRPNQTASNTLENAYALLGISPTANKQEVKRAYRKLMSRNHPDKLSAKGLSEEMIKIATEKTQKISKAYEKICESKGW